MELVAWTILCGVLAAGYVCLLLCRRILQSTTRGNAPLVEVGPLRPVSTSRVSSGAFVSEGAMRYSECISIRAPLTRADLSLGSFRTPFAIEGQRR